MAKYSVVFKWSIYKDLKPIPTKDVRRIWERIDEIAEDHCDPGCEKLSGHERYRVRQGSYRIVYEIVDEQLLVTVVNVGYGGDVHHR